MDQSTNRATLEVVSDVVCPWCYIGKHRLEQALALLPQDLDVELEVRWRPFELNPDMPDAGVAREDYAAAKFGSVARARALYDNVQSNAHADGLAMDVTRIERMPNTRAAHRLIEAAATAEMQDRVVDGLFRAYFVDGEDVGERTVLERVAGASGMDDASIAGALDDGAADETVDELEDHARALGIHSVPTFVYNGRVLFSGAQSAETISLSLARAVRKGL